MNSFFLLCLCVFVLVSVTNGLNCVSCVGSSNTGCNDPYNEATSGDLPVPGNTYCLKVVYPNYVERMAAGRTCTPGSGAGGSTLYCCSDKDYCNGVTNHISSTTSIVLLIMVLFFAKFKLL